MHGLDYTSDGSRRHRASFLLQRPQHLQTVLGQQLLPLRHRQPVERHHRLGAEARPGLGLAALRVGEHE